jgi:hypothetical protein
LLFFRHLAGQFWPSPAKSADHQQASKQAVTGDALRNLAFIKEQK